MIKFLCIVFFIFLIRSIPIESKSRNLSKKPGPRIIGGDVARAGQFPYSVSIYISTSDGTYFCSGALLNNDWVLTAAQCVTDAILFTIRLGSNSLTVDEESAVRVSTDTYFVHPDYNSETLENDVGLIKFRLPVPYSSYIQPINYLADMSLPNGSPVTTIGWGQINDVEPGLADHLNYVNVVTLSNEECRLTFGSIIKDNTVCAEGGYNEGTCFGDMGSPLIQYGSRGYAYHVGIASFISGNGCESTDPSGYTRTAVYREWIRSVVNNN